MSKIVERTLDFIELFAEERRPLSLSDIARLLKIPVSSCHDVLQSLISRGYLYESAPRAGYYPTLRLFETADTIRAYDPVTTRADKVLRVLRDQVGESVLLAKVSGGAGNYLLIFDAAHQVRFGPRPGDPIRWLHASSAGKAALGSMSDEQLEVTLESLKLQPLTSRTITSKTALRQDLTEAKALGWYLNDEETVDGLTTLSAVFNWGDTAYVVTVGGTTPRLRAKLDPVLTAMLEACRTLEMRPADSRMAEPRKSMMVARSAT